MPKSATNNVTKTQTDKEGWSVCFNSMMDYFYYALWESIFYSILAIQRLTVAHVVIHIGNKGDIHRSLKYCDVETSKHPWKHENIKWIYCAVYLSENKFNITKKGPKCCKTLFYSNIYTNVQIYTCLFATILKSEIEVTCVSLP